MDDLPVIHLCLFGCGLVVNSAPTRQSGLVPHTGLLSFCASAVQLGFVFCRRIWSFVASFRSEWNKEFKRLSAKVCGGACGPRRTSTFQNLPVVKGLTRVRFEPALTNTASSR